jgi:hypothetical protein
MVGWIKLHRKLKEHWIWKNEMYLKAWLSILFEVNFEAGKCLIETELIDCNRGQSLHSLNTWVKLFGKNWTIQKVRTFFELLKNDGMINIEGLRKTTRLTVCNYDSYQDLQQTGNRQVTDKQQTGNRQVTTIKEEKEIKKEKEGGEFTPPVPEIQNYKNYTLYNFEVLGNIKKPFEFWLKYRKFEREEQKESAYRELLRFSEGNAEKAQSIVDYSISGGYPVLYEYKNSKQVINNQTIKPLVYGKSLK